MIEAAGALRKEKDGKYLTPSGLARAKPEGKE